MEALMIIVLILVILYLVGLFLWFIIMSKKYSEYDKMRWDEEQAKVLSQVKKENKIKKENKDGKICKR